MLFVHSLTLFSNLIFQISLPFRVQTIYIYSERKVPNIELYFIPVCSVSGLAAVNRRNVKPRVRPLRPRPGPFHQLSVLIPEPFCMGPVLVLGGGGLLYGLRRSH